MSLTSLPHVQPIIEKREDSQSEMRQHVFDRRGIVADLVFH